MSSEFSGEDEFDCRLDLSGRKDSSIVESDELWFFSSNTFEGIMNERVHDDHGFQWDSNVRVHSLEDFVDVDWEGLESSSTSSWFLAGNGIFRLVWLFPTRLA